MNLRAPVSPPLDTAMGVVVACEVVSDDSGVFLFSLDEQGRRIADTWHSDVDAAKRQARFQFGIDEGSWSSADLLP